jgi:hypothetical protein
MTTVLRPQLAQHCRQLSNHCDRPYWLCAVAPR